MEDDRALVDADADVDVVVPRAGRPYTTIRKAGQLVVRRESCHRARETSVRAVPALRALDFVLETKKKIINM